LAIGRDVYADTRIILRALDARFPSAPGSSSPRPLNGDPLLAELFSQLSFEGGLFGATVALLPLDGPIFKDAAFVRDRSDLMGGGQSFGDMDARRSARPHAHIKLRQILSQLEAALADGRPWLVAGRDEVGAEDLNAAYTLEWATAIPGALDKTTLGPAVFPKVYAWIDRIRETVDTAKAQLGKPVILKGEQAVQHIKNAQVSEDQADERIVEGDPFALRIGDKVRVWPTDYGSRHKDEGTLVGLKLDEIIIEVKATDGSPVRLHTPRRGFAIVKVDVSERGSL
jgi:glutathione S-transferase